MYIYIYIYMYVYLQFMYRAARLPLLQVRSCQECFLILAGSINMLMTPEWRWFQRLLVALLCLVRPGNEGMRKPQPNPKAYAKRERDFGVPVCFWSVLDLLAFLVISVAPLLVRSLAGLEILHMLFNSKGLQGLNGFFCQFNRPQR